MDTLRHITGEPYYSSPIAPSAKRAAAIADWQTWWKTASVSWPSDPAFKNVAPVNPSRTDPAPDFDLTALDGREFSLSNERGRFVLLNFWGTWCPPCTAEEPGIEQIALQYGGQGLDVIGIATSEQSGDAVTSYCRSHGITFRQALATNEILIDYGNVEQLPVSVLIDREGRIRYRWDGIRDFGTFQSGVERVLMSP